MFFIKTLSSNVMSLRLTILFENAVGVVERYELLDFVYEIQRKFVKFSKL